MQRTDIILAAGTLDVLTTAAGAAVLVLAGWWAILRLSGMRAARIARVVLWAFGAGLALALAAFAAAALLAGTDATPRLVLTVARLSTLGATVSGLALAATAVILVWTAFARLFDAL